MRSNQYNILCLAIVHQGVAIPVLLILLDKKGNSNTDERIQLINRFIELFGVEKIDGYLADREFIGIARHRPAISFVTCHAAKSSN